MSEKSAFARYRKATGKKPEELAAAFGVDRATIYRWEKFNPPIPVKYLAEAERITGIPRHELRPDIFAEPAQ